MNNIRDIKHYKLQKKISTGTHDTFLYIKNKTKKPVPSKWVLKHLDKDGILYEFIAGKILEELIQNLVPSTKIIYDSKKESTAIASRYIENFVSLNKFLKNSHKDTLFPSILEFEKIIAYSIFIGDDDFHQNNIGISNNHYFKIDHGNALKINPETFHHHPMVLLSKSVKKYNYKLETYMNNNFINLLLEIASIDIEEALYGTITKALIEAKEYIGIENIKNINLSRISNLRVSSTEDIAKSIIISLKIRQKHIESLAYKLRILILIRDKKIDDLKELLRDKPYYLFSKYYWHIEEYSYIEDSKYEKSSIFCIKTIEPYRNELYELMIDILSPDISKIITQSISNITNNTLTINMDVIENDLFNKYKTHFNYNQLKHDIITICENYISCELTKEEIPIACRDIAKNVVNNIIGSSSSPINFRHIEESEKRTEGEFCKNFEICKKSKISNLIDSFRDKAKFGQNKKIIS